MAGLAVDVDKLDRFGGQSESVRTRMDAARQWTHQCDGMLSSKSVKYALHGFSDRWKDGRSEIDGNLSALSQMLTDSAKQFRDMDRKLADDASGKS